MTSEESEPPRGSKSRTGSDATREPEDDDDIPLDITGHEDREPPGESGDAAALLGESADADDDTARDSSEHDSADSSEDEDVEPVEVLVQLADDGEIDPWDIDVVRVTDKFLQRIDDADLRTSGRALFYASVLIRMKSDAMLGEGEDEEEPAEPWEQAMHEDAPIEEPDPFAALESEMDRRLERRRARGMPQTLDELVRDLRDAERDSWWKESREYDTSDSPSGFDRGTQELDYRGADDMRLDEEPSAADVTGTAHAENIDDIIADVHDAVREQYDKGREEVLYREVDTAGGTRVETFLGLLFLAHRGQVRLQQDDLFGDLWIQDPSAATGSDEAVAD
ncbi:condensin subunit ScpA [Haloarcula vallismortis]|uniref:Chromosome segregation and condensation protein ScpA n=2 Tax=Haloarcula vallismortis TaxID=28442 RepID=M0JF61_HALVA|nr:segregation/condensation protein A [Haloarcula vallismortis]EMA06639.1 chromosome segregation and condensation protein ScpA [Haloarcula vallismortis ATCC 29715]SDW61869.1 condensin subunit ScpA [Haloarcula vallismortis]